MSENRTYRCPICGCREAENLHNGIFQRIDRRGNLHTLEVCATCFKKGTDWMFVKGGLE